MRKNRVLIIPAAVLSMVMLTGVNTTYANTADVMTEATVAATTAAKKLRQRQQQQK